jgi:hypothetical protein
MVVMMVVVVMVRSRHCLRLRLRCDRSREAEDEEESGQKPFHVKLDGNRSSRDYRGAPAPVLYYPANFERRKPASSGPSCVPAQLL